MGVKCGVRFADIDVNYDGVVFRRSSFGSAYVVISSVIRTEV